MRIEKFIKGVNTYEKLIGMISILLVTITLAAGNQKEDNKNYRSSVASTSW